MKNWEGFLEANTSNTEKVASYTTTQHRSVSVSSSASTVPASSSANSITGDSSDTDDMFLTAGGDGFAEDNDNSELAPLPPRTARYRHRDSSPTPTDKPEFELGSRKVTVIKVSLHACACILPGTHSLALLDSGRVDESTHTCTDYRH